MYIYTHLYALLMPACTDIPSPSSVCVTLHTHTHTHAPSFNFSRTICLNCGRCSTFFCRTFSMTSTAFKSVVPTLSSFLPYLWGLLFFFFLFSCDCALSFLCWFFFFLLLYLLVFQNFRTLPAFMHYCTFPLMPPFASISRSAGLTFRLTMMPC